MMEVDWISYRQSQHFCFLFWRKLDVLLEMVKIMVLLHLHLMGGSGSVLDVWGLWSGPLFDVAGFADLTGGCFQAWRWLVKSERHFQLALFQLCVTVAIRSPR